MTRAKLPFLTQLIAVSVLALATSGSAAELRPRKLPEKSLAAASGPARDLQTLVVKLVDGAPVEARGGKWVVATGDAAKTVDSTVFDSAAFDSAAFDLAAVKGALGLPMEGSVEPLFSLPRRALDAVRRKAEQRSGQQLADLSQFYQVRLPPTKDGHGVLRDLLACGEVEAAYGRRLTAAPTDIPPATPDFNATVGPGQGYLDADPVGIDFAAAVQAGLTGANTTIADVEQSWNLDHEDLDHLVGQIPPVAVIPAADWGNTGTADTDHGTATLGVLAAGDNGYGVTGLTSSPVRVIPLARNSDPNWSGPDAVLRATLELAPGDVLLLEAQIVIGFGRSVPFETDPAEFAVVRQATALGIHVIQPAGNSTNGLDLDNDPAVQMAGGSQFDLLLRDSEAVMVGAGESALFVSPLSGLPTTWHDRYPNSNYGSRVDTYAWGQNIVTTGYGPSSSSFNLCADTSNPLPLSPPDPDQEYTYCYGGTSGAGAIVAGAAALLSDRHREIYGQGFAPRELRNLLRLGTAANGLTAWIGHQPSLGYQLNLLQKGGLIRHVFQAERRAMLGGFGTSTDYGRAVAGIGDVDGDGVPDVAIGAPYHEVDPSPDGSTINFGRVYVHSGAGGDLLYSVDGDATNDYLGCAVAGVDDLDDDGVPDFVASAPFGPDPSGVSEGYVRVFSGVDGSIVATVSGNTWSEECLPTLAGVGDLDGDGFGDFLIGEPQDDQVRVISGQHLTVLHTLGAPDGYSSFGHAVSPAGDLNGDGVTELLIGAPRAPGGASGSQGRAYVFSGASFALLRELRMGAADESQSPFAEFGYSVAGVGDVTGDAVPDFLIGAPGWGQPGTVDAGRAYLFAGNKRGVVQRFTSVQAHARRGTSVAAVGDFDGDGLRDLAVGQPSDFSGTTTGRAFVFLGPFPSSPGGANRNFWTRELDTRMGAALAGVGDLTGDGRDDLLMGEPWGAYDTQGRAYLLTAAPTADPFAGSARLVADLPAIEAKDVNGDGFGGGFSSPSMSKLVLDAGIAWAGASYEILGDQVAFVSQATGTLDGNGHSEAAVVGPIDASFLCPGEIGKRYQFTALVTRPAVGGGVETLVSNPVEIEIIHEFGGC